MPNVTLNLTGDAPRSVVTNATGIYQFSSLAPGWSYTVTPTKSGLTPGSSGITTVDLIATQRHFLQISLLSGCRLRAADVTGNNTVNTIDSIGIQRFFLGMATGLANTGQYQFNPASRTYPGLATDQTGQDYEALVLGDVAFPFAEHLDGPSQPTADDTDNSMSISVPVAPAPVAAPSFPSVTVDLSVTTFLAQVTTRTIKPDDNLVGFQGDCIFDSTVISFQSPAAQKAGLTAGNWDVSAIVLPGTGKLRTLRISAFSRKLTPLTGSGTLFELRMTRVSSSPGASAQLVWAAPPNNFTFIDGNLKQRVPLSAPSASVPIGAAQGKPAPPPVRKSTRTSRH